MNETLHIKNPLLFALLHIIDAAPFNAFVFAPRITDSFSRSPSLIPPNDQKRYPAFSYVVVQTEKDTQNQNPYDKRKLLTIEAALWEQMPKELPNCPEYITLKKYTNPDDPTEKTGLDVGPLATISNKLIEIQTKLEAIIYALDAKPAPNQPSVFETVFGFKREGVVRCRTFTNTSSHQLIGVVAQFRLWVNDNHHDYCNRCGWAVDMQQLTEKALADKIGVPSLKTCL